MNFFSSSSAPMLYVEQPASAAFTNFSPYNFLKKSKTELRVALHPGVTQGLFHQILPHFNYLNPHIKVKSVPCVSLNRKSDVNLQNSDIFIGPWNTEMPVENFSNVEPVITPLFNYNLRFFASKKYIEKPGRLENLHNIMHHPILGVKYSDLLNKPNSWHILQNESSARPLPLLMTIDHLSNFMFAQDGLAVVPWASEGIFWSPVEMVQVFSGIKSPNIPVSFVMLADSILKQEILILYKMLKEIIVHYQSVKGDI